MIDHTLSHYRIIEKIGAGGMGEVYIAEDTKLSRKVALKVLPPEMAENAERRTRFEREAKAVAALDHPNIVTIHSVEEAEGVHFYTMQLVKGKTLTELIPKKGMPLNKFFEVAIPLADAVSAAHEQGIIHRDLKPDNLMVGDDGRLKILDFGLAKLKPGHAESGISELPTQSATAEGRILGTVAYMSPEQAEGKTVDNRSDIFSIGIILYEMATGERPFKGDSAASLLSSILKDKPQSATEVNPRVPRDLGKIIRRCLVKDIDHRYQTAKDVRNELEELKQEVDSGEFSEGLTTTGSKKRWLVPVTSVIVALVAGMLGYHLRSSVVTEETSVSPIEGTFNQLTSFAGQELFPSISPDGEFFVYSSDVSGNWDIYLQRVGGERVINLTANSTDDDTQPAYSPDGKQIAFRSERDGGGIFLMGATGESVRRLTDIGFNPSWSPGGSNIVFTTEQVIDPLVRFAASQLWTASTETGEKTLLTEGDAVHATWSPSGKRIAFWSIHNAAGERTAIRNIWTINSTGGDLIQATDDDYIDWNPRWSPDGEYLYYSSDRGGSMNIWRVSIDDESGEVLAEPEPITTGASASRHHIGFDRSGDRLIYVERNVFMDIWKIAFDPASKHVEGSPIPVTRGSRNLTQPDVSPDGEWLACRATDEQEDIVIIRTDGTDRRQLTDDLHKDRYPQWSPDGRKIAFYSNRSGSYDIWMVNNDGSGLKQLTQTPGQSVNLPIWSPDGTHIAYFNRSLGRSYIFDAETPWEGQTPQQLPRLDLDDQQIRFEVTSWSPNGKRIAGYGTSTAGGDVGLVLVYSIESQKLEVLSNLGTSPTWLDDESLVFRDSRAIYLAELPSGNIRQLVSFAPDWIRYSMPISRDKRWIYFTGVKMEADIWMLTLNEERE